MGANSSNNIFSEGNGLRILKIQPNSPAQQANLQAFVDFIIDVETITNIKPQLSNGEEFSRFLQSNENQQIILHVFNLRNQSTRKQKLFLTKNWENADSLLGILLRLENYMTASEKTFKIIQVFDNSPASLVGLVSDDDYLVGVIQAKINDLNDLHRLLQIYEINQQPIHLGIYNIQSEKIKSISIVPNKKWGGQGLIGCEFGSGILNQLPISRNSQIIVEAESQNNKNNNNNNDNNKEIENQILMEKVLEQRNNNLTSKLKKNKQLIEKFSYNLNINQSQAKLAVNSHTLSQSFET